MESLKTTYQQSEGNLALAARPGKYLTFNLATEQYGLDILKIQEIAMREQGWLRRRWIKGRPLMTTSEQNEAT